MSRPLTRVLLGAAAVTLGLAGAVPAAHADPAAPASGVSVRITSFSPVAPKPGDTVTISGTAINTGGTVLTNPQAIACAEPDRIGDRTKLAALPADGTGCKGLAGAESTAFHDFADEIQPGGSAKFKITVPWSQWELGDGNGVYVVGVRINADDPTGTRLTRAITRTLMPVVSAGAKTREVRTAMMIPLRHRPTQLGGTYFSDESLLEAMDPEAGRLSRLLRAGSKQKVSWLLDPSLLDEARQLQKNYRTDGTTGVSPEPSPVARDWLATLERTIGKDPVVMLPYADPDIRALTDAGLDDLVTNSRSLTSTVPVPGVKNPLTGMWLDDGSITDTTLRSAAGTNLTVLSNWPGPRPDEPVVNVSTPKGQVKAVLPDPAFMAGGPDPVNSNTPIQLRQRFAAETALLALDGKAGPATVAVVPNRTFDTQGSATGTVLQAMTLPWVTPIGVNELGEPAKTVTPPGSQPYSPVLNDDQLAAVRSLDKDTATYYELTTVSEEGRLEREHAKLRAAAQAWRTAGAEGDKYRRYELGVLRQEFAKVRILSTDGPEGSVVTLSASKGRFPLTIANDLTRPIRVGLRIESLNRDDLKVEPVEPVRIRGGNRETFEIRASAQQNGLIKARVHIVTDSGRELGKPLVLDIRAAQYGTVGWVLVGSAVALLFGTSAIRIYRRIRSERRAAARTAQTQASATSGTPQAQPGTATAQAGTAAATQAGTAELAQASGVPLTTQPPPPPPPPPPTVTHVGTVKGSDG